MEVNVRPTVLASARPGRPALDTFCAGSQAYGQPVVWGRAGNSLVLQRGRYKAKRTKKKGGACPWSVRPGRALGLTPHISSP